MLKLLNEYTQRINQMEALFRITKIETHWEQENNIVFHKHLFEMIRQNINREAHSINGNYKSFLNYRRYRMTIFQDLFSGITL